MKKLYILIALLISFGCKKAQTIEKIPPQKSKQEATKNLTYFELSENLGKPLDTLISFTDLDAKSASISNFKNKIVVVNLWASWCRPCVEELPSLQDLQNHFEGKDVEVITINVEASDSKEKIEKFFKNRGFKFEAFQLTEEKFGMDSIPTTFIVDKNGNITLQVIGGRDWAEELVISKIDNLLKS